jgi:hypothetical protein
MARSGSAVEVGEVVLEDEVLVLRGSGGEL